MKNISQLVKDELKDFKIYPTIGNHDTYPQDDIPFLAPS